MAAAWTPLANTTLGSATSTISFTSISGLYRDLVLIAQVSSLSGDPVSGSAILKFNSDSGANYSTVLAYGDGSTTGSYTQSSMNYFSGLTSSGGMSILHLMDYSATDKHKSTLGRSSNSGNTFMYAGRWASTSAITSVTITSPDSGGKTFGIGSTFALYGVSA